MPTLKDYIYYVLIIAGVIALFLTQNRGSGDNVSVELKYDSIPHQINNSTISNPITVKPGEVNIPPAVITVINNDTISVDLLKQIYKELAGKHYEVREQTVTSADDSVSITAVNTITENRITESKLSYKIKFPVQHISNVNNPKLRNRVYVGAYVSASPLNYQVGADLTLITKKSLLWRIGWNASDAFLGNPYSFQGGVGVKLSVRKN